MQINQLQVCSSQNFEFLLQVSLKIVRIHIIYVTNTIIEHTCIYTIEMKRWHFNAMCLSKTDIKLNHIAFVKKLGCINKIVIILKYHNFRFSSLVNFTKNQDKLKWSLKKTARRAAVKNEWGGVIYWFYF